MPGTFLGPEYGRYTRNAASGSVRILMGLRSCRCPWWSGFFKLSAIALSLRLRYAHDNFRRFET